MNLRELKDLISDNESERLEFKRSIGQRTEAAKTVCAMLNGLGGFVLFERWGSGTLNIIDWCVENSNPTPVWSEQSCSVYVTFRPAVLPEVQPVAAQVPVKHPSSFGEDGTKSALSRHQVEILRKCQEEMALLDLMTITGRSDRTKFRDQVLNPLLDMGLIEMTIPDKPRSSKQKYRLTEKGQNLLVQLKRHEK
jgi:ATP-dependent DNA helicase RecG